MCFRSVFVDAVVAVDDVRFAGCPPRALANLDTLSCKERLKCKNQSAFLLYYLFDVVSHTLYVHDERRTCWSPYYARFKRAANVTVFYV